MSVGERGVKPGSGVNPRRSSGQRSLAFSRRRVQARQRARETPSGDQNSGSDHLRVAGAQPYPSKQAGGAEVERARRNQARGGGRGSDLDGNEATVDERTNGCLFWAPGTTLSADTCSNTGGSNCGRGGAMAVGEELSARCERRLEREIGHGERGNRVKGSPRSCREG